MGLPLRAATPADTDLIFAMIGELAAYEKLSHAVVSTPGVIGAALFAAQPRVFCDAAEWNGEPARFALWVDELSTFEGVHRIDLEDILVRPAFQHHGVDDALRRRAGDVPR